MKFAITTLGCKVNQYESQLIREALMGGGFSEQDFSSPGADLYIVNTCTVTHRSDAEDRKLIRKALNYHARLIVTGCQAKVYPYEIRSLAPRAEVIAFEDMGAALGIPLPSHIKDFCGHSRAFVNVQQGCNNHCTFCIVPQARGVPRSRPLDDIMREISELYETGFREIILTGINIGLYEGGVQALIENILQDSPMPRVRISSIEPWTLKKGIIELTAKEPRLCRHMHLPLQSGSDGILARMGRPYNAAYYRDLITAIRAANPHIAIGSDVMVGFPGESEEQFEQTYALVSSLDLAYLHVFPYSKRPKTPAASYGCQVDSRVVKERAFRLRELSRAKRRAFVLSQIGREEEMLVTRSQAGSFEGITSNYLKVKAEGGAGVNDLVSVVLQEAHDGYVQGRALG